MQIQRHEYLLSVTTGIVIVILVACGIDTSQTTIPPARKVTATPSRQFKETQELTATMEPTFVYWATAQEARLNSASTQVAETKQAITDLSTQYSQMCGYQPEGISLSPDGKWIATDCRFDGDFFRVFQTHEDQILDVPYSEVMKYYPEFIGSVRPMHWSPDGKTLYFASSSCCADTDAITNGDALYRLDLQTGEWTIVAEGAFSYYSFSPGGTRLIYLVNNAASANDFLRLHLLDLVTGKEEFTDVRGFGQGWIVWKDNEQKIALLAKNGNIYDDNMRFSLVVVDLQNKNQQPIILNTEYGLDVINWSGDDILTIRRSNVLEYNNFSVNAFDVMNIDLKTNLFITPSLIP